MQLDGFGLAGMMDLTTNYLVFNLVNVLYKVYTIKQILLANLMDIFLCCISICKSYKPRINRTSTEDE